MSERPWRMDFSGFARAGARGPPQGGQGDRNVRTAVEDGLQRLAEAGGVGPRVRDLVVLALVLDRALPLPDHAHDVHVFARLGQRLAEGDAVPALHDLRARDPQPQDEAAARELI